MDVFNKKKPQNADDPLELVSFKLGKEDYALDIQEIHEIIRPMEITRIPNASDDMEGIINVRENIIPLISLRKKLGFSPKEDDDQTRIIVLKGAGKKMGLIVDAITEVLRISQESVHSSRGIPTDENLEHVSGIGKTDGKLVLILDARKLFPEKEPPKIRNFMP